MRHAIDKVTAAGNRQVIVTERGVQFGYHNLVVDMRAFPIMRALGYPVVYDVTHSLQLPGGGDGVTAGQAEFIEPHGVGGRGGGRGRRVPRGPRASRRGRRATRRTRCGSIGSSRCSTGWCAFTRSRTRRALGQPEHGRMTTDTASALDLARKVLRTEAAAILGLVDRIDGDVRARGPAPLRVPRPRDRHRHGQVRHHLPQDRGDAVEHRHVGLVPPPGRSHPRRSRRDSRRRRRDRAVAQRRDRRAAAAARVDPADRRAGSSR